MREPEQIPAAPDERAQGEATWRMWLAVFAAALALYVATANRGAQWQDSGSHILRALTRELTHPLGLALVHPLHHWLSRFTVSLNVFEPCFAVTLISAVAGAVAVANLFGCVATLTRCRAAALLACGSLGLAHTFWQMATLAETYTLVAALLSAECWCLALFASTRRRGWLYAMLLFNGLGVANHMLASLTTPVLGAVLFFAVRRKDIRSVDAAAALGLWIVGSLPYTLLVATELFRTGAVSATIGSALFGQSFAGDVLNVSLRPRMLLISAGFVVLSLPLLLPAAVYGVSRAGRRTLSVPARRALLAGLVIHACFAARYDRVDQHTFFLPSYVYLSIFGGVGLAVVMRRVGRKPRRTLLILWALVLALTPVAYALVPGVARRFDVLRSVLRDKPYRDDYAYVFTPWSVAERSAERMSHQAVELAGEHGLIIVEDSMAEFAIRYKAIRGGHDGLQIMRGPAAQAISAAFGLGGAVVLVPARVSAPRTEAPVGFWKRVGDLYVLTSSSADP